jgi:hypothetical protein
MTASSCVRSVPVLAASAPMTVVAPSTGSMANGATRTGRGPTSPIKGALA